MTFLDITELSRFLGRVKTLIGDLIGTHNTAIDAHSSEFAGYVPNTRTVNNKALSDDIVLSGADIEATSSFMSGYTLSINQWMYNYEEDAFGLWQNVIGLWEEYNILADQVVGNATAITELQNTIGTLNTALAARLAGEI